MKKKHTKKFTNKKYRKAKYTKKRSSKNRSSKNRSYKNRSYKKRIIGGDGGRRVKTGVAGSTPKTIREIPANPQTAPAGSTPKTIREIPANPQTSPPEGWVQGGYLNVPDNHIVEEGRLFNTCYARICAQGTICQNTLVATENLTRIAPFNFGDNLESNQKLIINDECTTTCKARGCRGR